MHVQLPPQLVVHHLYKQRQAYHITLLSAPVPNRSPTASSAISCTVAACSDEDLPRRVNEKENALQKAQMRQAEADAVTDGSKSAIQRAIEIQANAESQELGVAAL